MDKENKKKEPHYWLIALLWHTIIMCIFSGIIIEIVYQNAEFDYICWTHVKAGVLPSFTRGDAANVNNSCIAYLDCGCTLSVPFPAGKPVMIFWGISGISCIFTIAPRVDVIIDHFDLINEEWRKIVKENVDSFEKDLDDNLKRVYPPHLIINVFLKFNKQYDLSFSQSIDLSNEIIIENTRNNAKKIEALVDNEIKVRYAKENGLISNLPQAKERKNLPTAPEGYLTFEEKMDIYSKYCVLYGSMTYQEMRAHIVSEYEGKAPELSRKNKKLKREFNKKFSLMHLRNKQLLNLVIDMVKAPYRSLKLNNDLDRTMSKIRADKMDRWHKMQTESIKEDASPPSASEYVEQSNTTECGRDSKEKEKQQSDIAP